ncbi:MAG: hypothetical protein QNJ97_08550 [Myxococcota bacterium]|nr:hypothetical protein [Myxococcota bacterium]
MKTRRMIKISSASLFIIGLIFLIISKFSDRNREPIESRQDGERHSIAKQGKKEIRSNIEKQSLKISKLNSLIKELKSSHDSYEGSLPPVGQVSEEHLKAKERMKKIQPYYWQKAPEILEEILSEQEEDTTWSKRVETNVKGMLSDELFHGTDYVTTHCGTKLCKVVVRHVNEEAFKTFQAEGSERGPWDGNLHGQKSLLPNGELRTSMYFSQSNDEAPFEEMRVRMLKYVEQL